MDSASIGAWKRTVFPESFTSAGSWWRTVTLPVVKVVQSTVAFLGSTGWTGSNYRRAGQSGRYVRSYGKVGYLVLCVCDDDDVCVCVCVMMMMMMCVDECERK